MREPFAIHPPHLDGSFRSSRGELRLTPLPGGRTRLEGTTWYTVGLWPESYWNAIASRLVATIHHRVLAHVHVKDHAERERPARQAQLIPLLPVPAPADRFDRATSLRRRPRMLRPRTPASPPRRTRA